MKNRIALYATTKSALKKMGSFSKHVRNAITPFANLATDTSAKRANKSALIAELDTLV